MRVRVNTLSGSVYVLDSEEMSWERINDIPGHEDIVGYYKVNKGTLAVWPTITVGAPMWFEDLNPSFYPNEDNVPIHTTMVVRAELI